MGDRKESVAEAELIRTLLSISAAAGAYAKAMIRNHSVRLQKSEIDKTKPGRPSLLQKLKMKK